MLTFNINWNEIKRETRMRMTKTKTTVIFIWIALTAQSCTLLSPHARKSPEGELPAAWSLYPEGSQPTKHWWKEFDDSELNQMVRLSLSKNHSLQEAWSRLKQARSATVIAGAEQYPDLTLDAGGSRNRQRTENTIGRSYRTFSEYTMSVVSGYEIDLWGKIRSEKEAARLEENASREDLNAAATTLAALVAENWVNIISQRMQIRLLEKQLETNQTFLDLIELRFRNGIVSALDVFQQKQVVEEIRAAIPLAVKQERLFLHDLAYLMGKPPKTFIKISRGSLPIPDEIPAIGIPADLLALRPDIRAAGLRLRAADWQVAAARADRLPSFSLTGTASSSSDDLDLLFDDWLATLAGNLTAPVLDGKRRRAEVDRSRARADELLWTYRDTVLSAVREVEDSLVSETKQREHIKGLELQIEAARNALERARENYIKGIDDYLPVLTQLLTVQGLERDLIVQRTTLVIDRISLYRSLGGTWTDELYRETGLGQARRLSKGT